MEDEKNDSVSHSGEGINNIEVSEWENMPEMQPVVRLDDIKVVGPDVKVIITIKIGSFRIHDITIHQYTFVIRT